jgi:hypothetical protein
MIRVTSFTHFLGHGPDRYRVSQVHDSLIKIKTKKTLSRETQSPLDTTKPRILLQMRGGLACKSTNSITDIKAYIFPANRAKELLPSCDYWHVLQQLYLHPPDETHFFPKP